MSSPDEEKREPYRPARWDPGAPGWPGSAHSAGWGSQPGGGPGSGYYPESASAAYGSGQWGRGPSQGWPGAYGGQSGTGYGPSGSGHSGYGQEAAARPGPFLHDQDYHQWREEQLRKLDSDYLAWRQERYRQFAEDFNAWRSGRRPGASSPDASATPAPAAPAGLRDTTGSTSPGHEDPSTFSAKPQ